MPKTNLTSRYTQERPAVVVQHKRRTEAEMRKALAIIDSKKELLRIHADDEHDVVLHDVVSELLEMRRIMMKLTEQMGAAHQDAINNIKNMSIT